MFWGLLNINQTCSPEMTFFEVVMIKTDWNRMTINVEGNKTECFFFVCPTSVVWTVEVLKKFFNHFLYYIYILNNFQAFAIDHFKCHNITILTQMPVCGCRTVLYQFKRENYFLLWWWTDLKTLHWFPLKSVWFWLSVLFKNTHCTISTTNPPFILNKM